MKRISCDVCTRDLLPGTDARYTVHIRGQLACESVAGGVADAEPDTDHIDAMDEMLTDLSDDDTVDDAAGLALPVPPMSRTFDLCGRCYGRFADNPLGRAANRILSFSAN